MQARLSRLYLPRFSTEYSRLPAMLPQNTRGWIVEYSATPQQESPSGPANDTTEFTSGAKHEAATMTRAKMRADARAPRNRINRRALGHTFQSIDIVSAIVLAAAGAVSLSNGDVFSLSAGQMLPLALFASLSPLLLTLVGAYRIEPNEPIAYRVLRAFIGCGLAGTAMIGTALIADPGVMLFNALFAGIAVSAMALLHLVYSGFIAHWRTQGRLARNIILVGATPNARKLITANQHSRTINVVGVFDDRKSRAPSQLAGTPYLGTTEDLFDWALLPEIDRVVLTVTPQAQARVQELLERLRALPQPVILLLDFAGFDPDRETLDDIAGVHTTQMSGTEERLAHLFLKRAQDIVLGSLMTLFALPIMALIALSVKLDSRGPAIFRQTREGFNGRPIEVYKFRTMRHDDDAEHRAMRQVERNDPRITRIGGFLRKTSLDELPQLFNVLLGSMSLVGPRPHALGMRTGGVETAKLVAEYAHRHRAKPGITGWAQINGSRGPLHTPEAARERIRWDVDYINRSGFWLDLWIMVCTLPALLGDKQNIR